MKENIKSIIREALCSYEERRYAVLAALQDEVAEEVADLTGEYDDDCDCGGDCRCNPAKESAIRQPEATGTATTTTSTTTPANQDNDEPETMDDTIDEYTDQDDTAPADAPEGKQWVTLAEGAAIIGCSRETLRRKALRGEYERRDDGRVTLVLIDRPADAAPEAAAPEAAAPEAPEEPEAAAPEAPEATEAEEPETKETEETKTDDDEEWE